MAHFLAERGREALVLDRGGLSQGTTGPGEGNVLVSDKLPGIERDMTVVDRELWRELGERFPVARVTAKGALLLDHPDSEPADVRRVGCGPRAAEGAGVAVAPISGLLLAQLICGEATVCDPAPVDPRRF